MRPPIVPPARPVKVACPLGRASDTLMQPFLSKIVAFLKPKRRWFRFTLRTMIIVMVSLATWMGLHVNSTQLQKQSVAVIYECGGSVLYDYHYPKGSFGRDDANHQATSPVPEWLVDLVGVDFFHDVVAVRVNRRYGYSRENSDADDRLLRQLRGCPELRRLELIHCGITDN